MRRHTKENSLVVLELKEKDSVELTLMDLLLRTTVCVLGKKIEERTEKIFKGEEIVNMGESKKVSIGIQIDDILFGSFENEKIDIYPAYIDKKLDLQTEIVRQGCEGVQILIDQLKKCYSFDLYENHKKVEPNEEGQIIAFLNQKQRAVQDEYCLVAEGSFESGSKSDLVRTMYIEGSLKGRVKKPIESGSESSSESSDESSDSDSNEDEDEDEDEDEEDDEKEEEEKSGDESEDDGSVDEENPKKKAKCCSIL